MEIDAVPRRRYYVLDLHGFSPAQVSVVHHCQRATWTRGLAKSDRALRRKKFVHNTSEAGVSNACVFNDFQRHFTKGAWLHANFAWRTSSNHILQTMEAVLSIFWMTNMNFGQVFDETSAEVDCPTTIAMAELAIRRVLSALATEAVIEMNLTTRMFTRFPEKLDFAAGEKFAPMTVI